MKQLARELQVNLGERSYPIRIGRDLGNDISGFINALTKEGCLLYTSPSPRDATLSRMPSSA